MYKVTYISVVADEEVIVKFEDQSELVSFLQTIDYLDGEIVSVKKED